MLGGVYNSMRSIIITGLVLLTACGSDPDPTPKVDTVDAGLPKIEEVKPKDAGTDSSSPVKPPTHSTQEGGGWLWGGNERLWGG